ncbi:DNA-directed DNA polymerase alpha catalytic subunit pol1 [Gaertneriomyces sp. JEL0708]|nr:DNA-directed DNA polymerase alpha catalytic subunit pol1 [Gaertneriomyces sp. JEL0708]
MSNVRAALKKLKENREKGISGLQEYQSSLEGRIYDELTEEEYAELRKRKLQASGDDFIIDDDGSGYVDYGQDEWASEEYSDDDMAEEDAKKKKGKRKRSENNENIKNMFSKQAKTKQPKPSNAASANLPKPTIDEGDLMSSIFQDLDEEVDRHAQKRVKVEPVERPLPRNNMIPRREEHLNPFISTTAAAPPRDDDVLSVVSFKTEPMETDVYEFQTQQIFPAEDHGEDGASTQQPSTQAPTIQLPESVKIKALNTVKASSLSFAPKFERKERAEATVVTASEIQGSRNWMNVREEVVGKNSALLDGSAPVTGAVGATDVLEEDGSLRVYWIDAWENHGVVYVFGKVQTKTDGKYVSCCIIVNNVQRNIYVLPRERMVDAMGHTTDMEVSMSDVYEEFDALRRRHQIKAFASATVTRNYAFELPDVPAESEYLKVVYPFSEPALPNTLSGKTFSHVFGTQTSALELFILKRKLMGPCWIEIKNATLTNKGLSWCKIEATVDDPKQIRTFAETDEHAPKAAPPLVVMSLSLRTVMNHKAGSNEIVTASGLVYSDVRLDGGAELGQGRRFTIMRTLNEVPLPAGFNEISQRKGLNVERVGNERGLLGFLIAQIHRADPDIIVGHNFIDFDLDVLLHRMKILRVDHWSRIGRLRRTRWPKLQTGPGGMNDSTFAERQIASGRLLCDTYRAAQDLVRSKSYSLTALALGQLGIERPNIEYDKLPQFFWDAEQLCDAVLKHCEFDAWLQMELCWKLQVLPLTRQLTQLAGNLWARTMGGARAERNEWLLLHEFKKGKFIVPDKQPFGGKKTITKQNEEVAEEEGPKTTTSSRRKPAYAGGLVLEPKKGFYDKFVVLLDFNSLYPSIIQEYNICFTTVERNKDPATTGSEVEGDDIPQVPDGTLQKGVLPRLLATLVERRRLVKSIMKNPQLPPFEKASLNIRQQALKLTANSMYGCLGFTHSRFYAKPLAMLITSKGREILQNTVDLAQTEGHEVVYGDTDSVMINTATEDFIEAKKVGEKVKKAVNARYKLLEMEVEGFFKRLVLLKKKKYAGVLIAGDDPNSGKIETKGLDLVRRDWCGLSKDVATFILNQIFSPEPKDTVIDNIQKYLQTVGEEVRKGLIPVEKYVITKSLTKNPEEYADAKTQPHVVVANKLKQRGRAVRVGDTIGYVVTKGEGGIGERARLPEDVTSNESDVPAVENDIADTHSRKGVIDHEWYLSNQVYPPVARVCSVIEGCEGGRLAGWLGLDMEKYGQQATNGAGGDTVDDDVYEMETLIGEKRFVGCEQWTVRCKWCNHHSDIKGLVRQERDQIVSSFMCPSPTCSKLLPSASLSTQLMTTIQEHIRRYANGWVRCDEAGCGARTRNVGVWGERCAREGCGGVVRVEYSDKMLYTQLCYFEHILSMESCETEFKDRLAEARSVLTQNAEVIGKLQRVVSRYLEVSGRRFVDLRQLFSYCMKP